ncbi:MAG TPA: hypothetical protein VF997_25165 [Polyangia bacterium]
MRTPTSIVMVAAALFASGGCSNENTVVTPASVPPAGDLGVAPEGGGGVVVGACPATPVRFAAGLAAEASDGSFLYGFSDSELRRVPLSGGTPAVVVARTNRAQGRLLMVDDAFVYWVIAGVGGSRVDAIVRAPKSGGAPVAIGYGNGVEGLVVADAIYFVGGGLLKSVPLGGGLATTLDNAALVGGAGQALGSLGVADDFLLHTRTLATPVTTHSLGPTDSDGTFLFAAMPLGEVRRYALADGSFTVVYRSTGTAAVALRLDGDRLYVAVGGSALVRLGKDGAGATTIVPVVESSPRFVVAGDSVFYGAGVDTWRVCK